ncbi:hypothetical protein OB2597_02572 [Pseudooceanicola batsensis HTCC2597]|uniref:Uncharacterized protein n=1 Tax=Pseudooceanicola batsensis (strain ATCC BAA-863 / DSM 15984 / KCTC 12145 / HTCC2597) TaxID=252305 RepID=A3TXA8_PSEBH|nr:hypothetical protein [Pseudooceanicola batsensis]EAQ03468.1 hypothetical protein OB2597_02572 [Pseudooceanicola batsensis HTCC2597]
MSTDATVRTRRVFYVPGYDPFHPRRYRELYRREGAEQARISGYDIALRPRTGQGPYGWHVISTQDGATVKTEVEVLYWSDIVRDSMAGSIPATYAHLVRTASVYIFTGALFRLMRLRKGPVIAALYPVTFLIVQLLVALGLAGLAGWGLARIAGLVTPQLAQQLAPAGWLAAPVVLILVLRWFRKQDNRFFAYYLMHDYSFSASTLGANSNAMEERISEFGNRIRTALASNVDEVLVIGHSSGAHLAVSILSDLIRAKRVPANGPVLSFLSLGHVVPMVSFLPRAQRLRADLAFLSTRDELTWIDVTAPGDGCAFALCDPVAVSGVAPEGKRWPLILSAAFTQTLSPDRWKALRWRFFRLHFQYLCAFDRPDHYDYFRITAGPLTLYDRYRGKAPSKSRIETPVNRYRSVA